MRCKISCQQFAPFAESIQTAICRKLAVMQMTLGGALPNRISNLSNVELASVNANNTHPAEIGCAKKPKYILEIK